ncbi:hypothetical protein GQ457_01G034240 [Hibiscus cannabinus]
MGSCICYSKSSHSFTSSVKWLRSSTQSVKRLPFLPEERKNRMLYLPPFPEGRTGLIELSLTCFLFPWDGMSFAMLDGPEGWVKANCDGAYTIR